jgi:hypothetical protein
VVSASSCLTSRAAEARWPPQLLQGDCTRIVAGKLLHELTVRVGDFLFVVTLSCMHPPAGVDHARQYISQEELTDYPLKLNMEFGTRHELCEIHGGMHMEVQ